MSTAAVVASAIFLCTLYMILARPRNIRPHTAAALGALAALATRVVGWGDVVTVAGIVWNATFALVAIIVISTILDEAGFFQWAALHMARRAGGDGRRAFAAIVLLTAAVAALFTNDSAVLILTPIVLALFTVLGFGQRQVLPYLMACGFVADAMSIPFSISNLTNIIAADYFHLSFGRFALLMALPSAACLLASLLVLWLYYRKEIPERFDAARMEDPAAAIRDPVLFRLGAAVLAAMLIAFLASSVYRVPVSFIIGGGALILLLGTRVRRAVDPVRVLTMAPWGVVLFSLGMYLVVYGLNNAGLIAWTARALAWMAGGGMGAAILGTGLVVTVFSAVMNNLPAVMVGSLAVAGAAVAPAVREAMVYANVIGSDIGPKLTPIGSLATLIWLHYLNRKGMDISWQYYLRVGLAVTPPVLLAALLALWAGVALFA